LYGQEAIPRIQEDLAFPVDMVLRKPAEGNRTEFKGDSMENEIRQRRGRFKGLKA
jgi:hypothetical protein